MLVCSRSTISRRVFTRCGRKPKGLRHLFPKWGFRWGSKQISSSAFLLKERTQPSSSMIGKEHTSELQSLAYLVCRLLLEKKKPEDLGAGIYVLNGTITTTS